MSKFVQLAETFLKPRTLIPLDVALDVEKLSALVGKSPASDWYVSLYYYPEDMENHFATAGTVAGYNGPAYSTTIFFDFDSASDLNLAKQDVLQLCQRLKVKGVKAENIRIYFSGSKGFHLELHTGKEYTDTQIKNIVTQLTKDLTTADTQIYDKTRIIRVANTRHNKTKLYKIELNPVGLAKTTVEEIKSLAKTPITIARQIEPLQDSTFLDELALEKKEIRKAVFGQTSSTSVSVSDNSTDSIRGLREIEWNKCPATMPRCIYALTKGVMVPGSVDPEFGRSKAFFRLAAWCRNQGQDKEAAYGFLKGVARLNARLYPESEKITPEELWNQHIATAYGKGADVNIGGFGTAKDNELVKRYCDAIESAKCGAPNCKLHSKGTFGTPEPSAIKIGDMADIFADFAANLETNTIATGIRFIDEHMKIAVGTTTLLCGASGSGKTSLCLNILENANKNGLASVFFSMDMNKNLVFLKLAQKLTPFNQEEILEAFRVNDTVKKDIINKAIQKTYSNTFFDFSSTLSFDEMKRVVQDIEKTHDVKVKFVMVDYASRISGPHSDAYANARFNALKSTSIAEETKAAWIILSQVSRATGDGSTPLRTKRVAKESGDWEESATNVINIWRPYMGMHGHEHWTEDGNVIVQDNIVRVFLAKNRMGAELEIPLHWNGPKGAITDMSEDDLMIYKDPNNPEGETLEKVVQKAKGR